MDIMSRIKSALSYIIIMTFPIMSIIDYFGVLKFNTALSDIFIILLVLVYLIDYKRFSLKKQMPYLWYFFGLILICIASIIASKFYPGIQRLDIYGYINEVAKFLIIPLYFYAGYNSFNNQKQYEKVVLFWTIGLWITIIIGLVTQISYFAGHPINWHNVEGTDARLRGGFNDPNLAGTYLTISFFMTIVFIKLFKTKSFKFLGAVTIGLIILCIFLTQSRGTYVGFGAAVLLYCIFRYKEVYKPILLMLPIFLIVYFGFIDLDFTLFEQRIIDSIENRIESTVEGKDSMLEIRKNLSIASILAGLDHPIVGFGRGNFVLNSAPYVEKIYDKKDDYVYKISTEQISHNTFAGIFAEMGFSGLLLFSSLFVIIILSLLKTENKLNRIYIFAITAFFIESLVLSLENFRGFWLVMGIMLKLRTVDIIETEDNMLYSFNRLIVSYLVTASILSFALFFDTARKVPKEFDLTEGSFEAYIDNITQNVELKYRIITSTTDDTYCSRIRVFNKNTEEVYAEEYYRNADGLAKIDLVVNSVPTTYGIEFESNNGEKTKSILKYMYYTYNDKRIPVSGFKYLPISITDLFSKWNILWFRKEYVIEPKKTEFPIKFDNGMEILDASNYYENDSEYIKLKMKTGKKLDKDYYLRFNVTTDNINNIEYVYTRKNPYYFRHGFSTKTSEWEINKEYEFKYSFKGENTTSLINGDIPGIKDSQFSVGIFEPDNYSLLDYLNNMGNNELIILSVRYDGSRALEPKVKDLMNQYGLEFELLGNLQWSYAAIFSKNGEVTPIENMKNEKIEIDYIKGDKLGDFKIPFDIHLVSAGGKVGNVSSILIDGKEYSKNKRGINIVKYDLDTNQIIDSTYFDTYLTIYQ